jgi:hypothetical protein
MKEILNNTKYGEIKNALIEKKDVNEFSGWKNVSKKLRIEKENISDTTKKIEAAVTKEIVTIKIENLPETKNVALVTPVKEKPQESVIPTIKTNHNLKSSDLTSKKMTQLQNQLKSIIFNQNSADKKITHRRTASEGASKNTYDYNFHLFLESEKTKLQKLNQSGKFYFYGEKRDAHFESAMKKAEEREKYVGNLIEGYNFSSDFKKKVTDYVNRLDE